MYTVLMHAVMMYFRLEFELWCHVEGILHAVGVDLQLQRILCTKDHSNNAMSCMQDFPFSVVLYQLKTDLLCIEGI